MKLLTKSLLPIALAMPLAGTPDAQAAPAPETASAKMPYGYKYVDVHGSKIAYIDEGKGDPVLFIHGNPTSSYLWRNILPHVEDQRRIIALDLVGFGKSDKPDMDYSYQDHYKHLTGFIEALDLKNITLVIHDWGSALGMHYARENEPNVRGLAFMEAIVAPAVPIPDYESMGAAGEFFKAVRTPGVGEKMILDENMFVEVILPEMGVAKPLADDVRAVYREPFQTRESRLPTLVFPRIIPIGGEPEEITAITTANGDWLANTPLPKLYFYAKPGGLNPAPVVDYFQKTLPNLETRFIGAGVHYLQEDQPDIIGQGLSDWLRRN